MFMIMICVILNEAQGQDNFNTRKCVNSFTTLKTFFLNHTIVLITILQCTHLEVLLTHLTHLHPSPTSTLHPLCRPCPPLTHLHPSTPYEGRVTPPPPLKALSPPAPHPPTLKCFSTPAPLTHLEVLLHPGEPLELCAQLEGRVDGILAGERDVGLAGQAPEGVQAVLGQAELVELHLVAALLAPARELVRLEDRLPAQQQQLGTGRSR